VENTIMRVRSAASPTARPGSTKAIAIAYNVDGVTSVGDEMSIKTRDQGAT